MSKRIRLVLAVVIFILSAALLAWGLWPSGYLTDILKIPPDHLQLPNPGSLLPGWIFPC